MVVEQIFNRVEKRISLCARCANRIGIRSGESPLPLTVGDLYAPVLDPEGTSTRDKAACPRCATTFREIRLSGRVGCSSCYDAFHDEIAALLPRVANSTKHEGSVPSRLHTYKRLFVDKADLRSRLEAALQAEDYEAAAALRDQIHEIDEEGDI